MHPQLSTRHIYLPDPAGKSSLYFVEHDMQVAGGRTGSQLLVLECFEGLSLASVRYLAEALVVGKVGRHSRAEGDRLLRQVLKA